MIALQYHESTKHHFNRFARSLGYLDWATQPNPFRRYAGAAVRELPRTGGAADTPYDTLFDSCASPVTLDEAALGEFLRCSMGLSAWKQFQSSRWALRVNPSSGNLHPTEAYVVWNGRVCHYAPREHALEERCLLADGPWRDVTGERPILLVGLTSILWREAWKYGERAFRYCQHDVGHAFAALRLAAAMLGWRMTMLARWSDDDIAVVLGVDRDADFRDAEREEPECLAVVTTAGDDAEWCSLDPAPLVAAARAATWRGIANQLSASRIDWPIIDAVAKATRVATADFDPSTRSSDSGLRPSTLLRASRAKVEGRTPVPASERRPKSMTGDRRPETGDASRCAAREAILRRRSAVAFDARSSLPKARFLSMLRRLEPVASPFDALAWPPQIHLALFVHRVDGVLPGIYAWLRDDRTAGEWRAAMRPDFLWEEISDGRLFLLAPLDVRWIANRVSCDQDIAADGFFSLGMIARFEQPLRERGEWFYRRLFWETGVIGQVLYLEAEGAGARATGIGCFYDDPVHDTLGLSGQAWQSLYHFSMGVPVEDARLASEPGYDWEAN